LTACPVAVGPGEARGRQGFTRDAGKPHGFPARKPPGRDSPVETRILRSRALQAREVNVIYPTYQAAEVFRSWKEDGLFDRPEPRALRTKCPVFTLVSLVFPWRFA
jgi:hypothetical protein